MHYYPHHIGDYQRDTAHLSLAEHGAYRLLMDAYYVTEKPLPDDLAILCRIVRAVSKAERDAVETVVRTMFVAKDGTLNHHRIEEEVARFQDLQAKAVRAGKASAAKRTGRRPPNERPTPVERPLDPGGGMPGNEGSTDKQPTSTQDPTAKERESNGGAWVGLDEVMAYAPVVMAAPECAESFWNSMESCGWVNKFGLPVSDWRPLFRNYTTAWKANDAQRKSHPAAGRPRHTAYDAATATRGLTAEQIGVF